MTTPSTPSLGSFLLEQEQLKHNRPENYRLSTQCLPLDEILDGGFDYGCISSISSSFSSPRTLIVMRAFAMHLLSDPGTESVWIDTTGCFPGAALKEIIGVSLLERRAQIENGVTVDELLKRAKVTRVFDMRGLSETIDEIKQDHWRKSKTQAVIEGSKGGAEGRGGDHKAPYESRNCGVRLIVVDSITQPLAAMSNKSQLEGQSLLATLQRNLSLLARAFNIVVLLLNDIPSTTTPLAGVPFYQHNALQSAFASTSWRLTTGPTYTYGADLHLLVSMHPHDPANAVATEASSRGRLRAQGMALTGGMKEDVVVEVVADRVGGRTGRWTACRMTGTELILVELVSTNSSS